MPIILLGFVNYARFSPQKIRNNASTLYFKRLVKTSQYLAGKRQNHFPYVHKETLGVLNSLSDKHKYSNNNQPTRGRHPR